MLAAVFKFPTEPVSSMNPTEATATRCFFYGFSVDIIDVASFIANASRATWFIVNAEET